MEEIKVYNTLTGEKTVFRPLVPGEVKIYVCGVTPYNHPHIGNARPAVTWDVICRYLKHIGYKVEFVQNFTDVDDKIINKANAEGSDWKTISDRYIDAYFQVMDAMHVRRADVYPRVSDHMQDIIDMVQRLIDKGHAYVLGMMFIMIFPLLSITGRYPDVRLMTCWQAHVSRSMRENAIPAILLSGRGPNRMNRSGKVPGERDVPAGTLNAPPCLSIIWERLLISMAAAAI